MNDGGTLAVQELGLAWCSVLEGKRLQEREEEKKKRKMVSSEERLDVLCSAGIEIVGLLDRSPAI